MILYVHTDLTGRYQYREADNAAVQPHLARLAWLLEDDGEIVMEESTLIKPERSWTYEPDAIAAHQIHPSIAQAQGKPLIEAIEKIDPHLRHAETLCAFNWDHHARVLMRSYHDIKGEIELPGLGHPRAFCAMREATDYVRNPRMQPGGGYRWPSMRDAYKHFAGDDLPKLANPIPQGRFLVRATRTIARGIQEAREAMLRDHSSRAE